MIPLGSASEGTHQTNPVDVKVRFHVFNDVPIWHPLGHHLEGINRDTKTLSDVWMVQPRPYCNFPVEFLGDVSQPWFQVKAFTHFLLLLKFHYPDVYIVLVGTPLRTVELPHPYLGMLIYVKRWPVV